MKIEFLLLPASDSEYGELSASRSRGERKK